VSLDQARSVTATFALLPQAPTATGDHYATEEDTPLNVNAPGVLGNDSDRNGDTLTAVPVSGPAHGDLALRADGSFTYAPDRDFNGRDSFTYRAGDGALESEAATATIDVAPVDDPAPTPPPPPAGAAPTPPSAEPAISRLLLRSRCLHRSRSGRVRIRLNLRLARPGPLRIRVDRAVGSRNRRSCPRPNPTRHHTTRFRKVTTVRSAPTGAVAASVPRQATLDLRLRPGLYRLTIRAQLEGGRLSPSLRRFLRVVG
jgi:hypothetical protein